MNNGKYKNKFSIYNLIFLAIFVLYLSACGGGSEGVPPGSNQPPSASAGADQTVEEGALVTLSGTGSDSDGSIVSYNWTQTSGINVTLADPTNSTATFTAPLTDSSIELLFTLTITDNDGATATDQVTISVNSLPQGTYIKGKILDTNAFTEDGTELPIVGVEIRFMEEPVTVISDENGEFIIDNLEAGEKVIDFNSKPASLAPSGDTYASFREHISISSGANIIERPFYLPRIASNSLTPIDPNADTVVTNPDLGISLTVFAGSAVDESGELFTGELSISEVPEGLAPAVMPDALDPGLLFTIQPVGVVFNTPATLSIDNSTDNWPVGSKINFWSLDPDLGVFSIVGDGEVSADGATIETVSGGVRAADWHAPLPDSVDEGETPSENDGDCQGDDCCDKCIEQVGSEVELSNGRFREMIELPSYRSINEFRSLEFVYSSDRAFPMELMVTAPIIQSRTPVPNQISYRATLDGTDQDYEIFLNSSTVPQNQTENFLITVPLDATKKSTDLYASEAIISSHYNQTTISTTFSNEYMIVNDIASEFGAGWRLKGLQRIYPLANDEVMLVDESGYPLRFGSPIDSGPFVTIIADRINFNDAILWGLLLDEMGIAHRVRHTFGDQADEVSMDDIDNTSLFIFAGHQRFPLFGTSGETLEQRINVLDVIEEAQARGVSVLITGELLSPFDTGFGLDSECCVRDPETARLEALTGLVRSSSYQAVDAPLGVQRLWQLLDPEHPLFNGPAGLIEVDAESPVENGLGTEIEFATFKPQLLNANEVPLVRAYQDNGTATALTNEYLITETSHPSSGARSVAISISIGKTDGNGVPTNDPAIDPFITTLFKNAVSWLILELTLPDQYISPKGDFSKLFKEEDGGYTRQSKYGVSHSFDAVGLLQSVTDRNGNVTTYRYDSENRLISITDPLGKITTFNYAGGLLSSVTDPFDRTSSFEFDGLNNLTLVTFPDNSTRQFAYDERHLMSSQTDPLGNTTSYLFNSVGQFEQSTQPDGSVRNLLSAQSAGLVEDVGNNSSENPAPIKLKFKKQ